MRNLFRYGAMTLAAAFLVCFLVVPVLLSIRIGLEPALLLEVCRNPVYREGLCNSLAIAGVTTLLVMAISLPLALLYDRYDFPGKGLTPLLMMLPMILPPFVGALGFQRILGEYGVVNTILRAAGLAGIDFLGGEQRFFSVCLMEALHLYPICYLNLVAALGNIDPAMNEAARTLGASGWYRFRRVTLPLLKPGIFAGGSIVLVWSFTELGTPLMFGYNRVTPVQILNGLTELGSNPVPFALVVIMLIVASLLYLGSRFALGRHHELNQMVKGNATGNSRKLAGWRKFLPLAAFGGVAFLTVLPHIALVLSAFTLRWYGTLLPQGATLLHFEQALSNKLVLPSISNSLRYSVLATLLAAFFGVTAALANTRWKLKGAGFVDLLAMIPLAVPGIVVAFGYLGMMSAFPWTGDFFNPVGNPLWLLGIAYAVRRIPYVVRSVTAGLEQTSEELENAARSFGASPWRCWRKVTFPLIFANILIGALFAFSFSMLEVSDSLILAQKAEFYPITRAIYDLSQILGVGPSIACAFGVWTMAFLAATLGAAAGLLGRKIGSVFKL